MTDGLPTFWVMICGGSHFLLADETGASVQKEWREAAAVEFSEVEGQNWGDIEGMRWRSKLLDFFDIHENPCCVHILSITAMYRSTPESRSLADAWQKAARQEREAI